MVQVLYTIVKENELIFAQNIQYNNKGEAIANLKALYEEVKSQENIKDFALTDTELVFTDTAEGDSDEIHKFVII